MKIIFLFNFKMIKKIILYYKDMQTVGNLCIRENDNQYPILEQNGSFWAVVMDETLLIRLPIKYRALKGFSLALSKAQSQEELENEMSNSDFPENIYINDEMIKNNNFVSMRLNGNLINNNHIVDLSQDLQNKILNN